MISSLLGKSIYPCAIRRRSTFQSLLTYSISDNSQKIKDILRQVQITGDNQQSTNLYDSGIIAHQHFDPDSQKLSLSLNLNKDYMKIKNALKEMFKQQGFHNVDIKLAAKEKKTDSMGLKGNLNSIKNTIAIYSCKGGVGKSTVAVNFAATLKNAGFRVGIFDADIYGPSLPTLIRREGEHLEQCEDDAKQIQAKEYEGMKCMSFGFVGSKPAAMRGPMVSSIVSQLLHQTAWGELDYLIVDMPPGTGDIQISLCQQLKFDGTLIVTTPQRLAFIDVVKGIEMFQDLRVRILGVVENMSYYQCSKCGSKDEIFGRGYTQMLMQQFGIQNAFRIPLMGDISKYSDAGTPFIFVLPDEHIIKKQYCSIQQAVEHDLIKPKIPVHVRYSTTDRTINVQQQKMIKKIDPYTLRLKCKCAVCVNEMSGQVLLKQQEIDPEVYPIKIEEKGNYAVAVVWSDGHKSSIYPYRRLFSSQIPDK